MTDQIENVLETATALEEIPFDGVEGTAPEIVERTLPEINENNILFLIGAGCSAEGNVKVANSMVKDIEDLVEREHRWIRFKELYCYLKSSILYSYGILGDFTTALNIEKLVVIINELAKKESNLAYPFIGNWNTRLIDVAGKDFQNIKDFGEQIKRQLYEWINIGDYTPSNYYCVLR